MKIRSNNFSLIAFQIFIFLLFNNAIAQIDSTGSLSSRGVPVIFTTDTLFYINNNIGPFTPQQRADAIINKLNEIVKRELNPNFITVKEVSNYTNIELDSIIIMSISKEDAASLSKTNNELGLEYASKLKKVLRKDIEIYSTKSLLINIGTSFLYLIIVILLFWLIRKLFPKGYSLLESWDETKLKPIKIYGQEILSTKWISSFLIVLLKLIRLAASLSIIYYFISKVLSLWPLTKGWEVRPALRGILFAIIISTAVYILFKSINKLLNNLLEKSDEWRGTIIKPVKVKELEILSDERILGSVKLSIKIIRFLYIIILGYFYITLLFSLYSFTRTWAATLFGYIISPLGSVISSFIHFLPNLFTILVIIIVTRYVIKFVKFVFNEIGRGTVTFKQFPIEWAEPTFKIVRFLIIVFAAIVIFPYLPGSESPIFRGISIFLGILFSLGSTSAISNIVGGVVLTYMRPFKLGDRVKIADTVGDVIDKSLLVTRVRTIKNVDITIPNAMVLGSHIINFSSSADDLGLIVHTSVTIGYDAPWRKVHELLISAALSTKEILTEPKPFVLQTALSDFYVSYEINAYTNKPNLIANIYSDLHQNIQDKFNEAGVEIMSPHYTGMRDGNSIKIPDEYLPKNYKQPGFKISPLGNLFEKRDNEDI